MDASAPQDKRADLIARLKTAAESNTLPGDLASELLALLEPSPSEVVINLRRPIQFGKDTIDSLILKPRSRAFRDLVIPMSPPASGSGQPTLMVNHYALALVGLKMAGHVAAAERLVDDLDPKDMAEVASAVFGFFS